MGTGSAVREVVLPVGVGRAVCERRVVLLALLLLLTLGVVLLLALLWWPLSRRCAVSGAAALHSCFVLMRNENVLIWKREDGDEMQ